MPLSIRNQKSCNISLLTFGNVLENEYPFDFIIGSEIIYEYEQFLPLITTIKNSLAPNGSCYLFCIERISGLFSAFFDEVKKNSMNVIRNDLYSTSEFDNFHPVIRCNTSKTDSYHMMHITHS